MKKTNPKDLIGFNKPSLCSVPMRAVYEMGKAMGDGERKYGRFNWREESINSDIYIDAALRHINSWQDGENVAKDSGFCHIAHAMACLAILIDADCGGNLIDNRSMISPGGVAEYIEGNIKAK